MPGLLHSGSELPWISKMWEHWKEITGLLAIIGFFLTWGRYLSKREKQARREGNESGKADGAVTAQVCNIKKRVNNHAERIHTIEDNYMSENEHDKQSVVCQKSIDRRLTENHDNLQRLTDTVSDMEEKRQKYREEDNKWKMSVTETLARVEGKLDVAA